MTDTQNNTGNLNDFFAKVDPQTESAPNVTPPVDSPSPPINQVVVEKANTEPATPFPAPDFPPTVTSPAPVIPESPEPPGNKIAIKKTLLIFAVALFLIGIIVLFFGSLLPKLTGKKESEVTLTYWGLWEPAATLSGIIEEYQKSHPKVKINYVQNLGESTKNYRQRLRAALDRGEIDIFRFHNTWTPMFRDLLSPVPANVMDAAAFEKTYYPVVRTDLKLANGYVGLPLMMDGLALYYNEDIFATAGKLPPKTWEEFRQLAVELTVRDSTGKIQTAGAALGTTNNVDHWSEILGLMLLQNNADLANPTDNFAADAISFYLKFASDHRVWDSSLPPSTYSFASGRLAMYFGPSWRVFDIKTLNPGLKFKIIPVPQLSGVDLAWASYWVEGVSSKSTHAKEAWDFLQFLATKETMAKLYQNESQLRLFGEPYSRTDMADLLRNELYVGAYIQQAVKAKSWYLCARTYDNGINDEIIKYYEDAVNAIGRGENSQSSLATAAMGINQVLAKYGLK